jgi:hypothetical protein
MYEQHLAIGSDCPIGESDPVGFADACPPSLTAADAASLTGGVAPGAVAPLAS